MPGVYEFYLEAKKGALTEVSRGNAEGPSGGLSKLKCPGLFLVYLS